MTKIISNLSDLKKKIKFLKKNNKKIVHSHGVFDLIHLGHIQHFKEAKSYGNILIVTVTSDKFVKKGFNKPYFDQSIRCEMLAELEIVNYVFCNNSKSSANVLKIIKPNYYAKGPDYKKKSGDIAGNLNLEKRILKKIGGKLIITTGAKLSSTKILNDNDINISNENRVYLTKFKKKIREQIILKDFNKALSKIKNQKTLIIGEIIIDEYLYSQPQGQPSKENILAVNHIKDESFLGGSIPVVKNISQICNNVVFCSIFRKESIKNRIKNYLPKNVKLKMFHNNDYIDIKKKRYVNINTLSKIFETYKYKNKNFNDNNFHKFIKKNLKKFDHVIVCDFGHGLINKHLANFISNNSKFLSANIQTNSGNRGFNLFTKYKKIDFLCIDEPELRLGISDKISEFKKLIYNLNSKKYKNIMITQGVKGLSLKLKNNKLSWLPAYNIFSKDTLGAGDAVFSFSSILTRNSKNDKMILIASMLAGAIKVNIIGHRTHIDIDNLYKSLISFIK